MFEMNMTLPMIMIMLMLTMMMLIMAKMYSGKCRQVTVTLHYLSIGDPAKKHNSSLTLMMMMMMMINMMHAYDKYIK